MPSNEILSIGQTVVGASSISAVPFAVSGLTANDVTGIVSFYDGTNTVAVPVSGDGSYSANLSSLQNGTVFSELTYSGSASGTVAGSQITLDTVPPTITVQAVATDDRVNATELASGFTVNGTTNAEDNQTVTITLLDSSNSVVVTDTASVLDGAWSANVTASQATGLADGQYTVTAGVSDLAGNPATAAQQPVTVDATPPTVMSVTAAPGTGDFDAGHTILLTMQMSEAVTVDASGGVPTLALNDGGTASFVSGSGTSALVFNYMVAPGDNVASLAVTGASLNGGVIADLAGNPASLVGATSILTGTVEIDTTAPSVAITGPLAGDDVLNASEAAAGLTVSGTTTGIEDGQTLSISILDSIGTSVGTASATVTGNAWSLGFSAAQMQALADGSYTVQAAVADAAGNAAIPASLGLRVDETAPVLAIASVNGNDIVDLTDANNGFTITGTADAEDGQAVQVAIHNSSGAVVDSYATAVTSGMWSVTVTSARALALHNASYTVVANVSDAAGNPALQAFQLVRVDETPPTLAINAPIAGDDIVNKAEAASGFTVSGTTVGVEAGQVVTVTLLDSNGSVAGTFTTSVANNAWSLLVPAAQASGLADGSYTVDANVADSAGNPASLVSRAITVDRATPSLAITTPIAGDNIVNAAEEAAGFTISGTTDAETGQTVTVSLLDSADVLMGRYTTTVSSGAWLIGITAAQARTLSDDSYTVQATVSNHAGNPAVAATEALVVDATPPSIAISTIAGDNIVNAAEAVAGIVLSGTTIGAEDGQAATIKILDASNVEVAAYAATVGSGAWTVTVPAALATGLADGLYTVTATVTDVAGTVSAPTSQAVTVDETAPTLSISTIAGDDIVNKVEAQAGFTISGTVADNSSTGVVNGQVATIVLLDGSNAAVASYTATIQNGAWSIGLSPTQAKGLADGTYTVAVDATDAARNAAPEAIVTLRVDQTPPTIAIGAIDSDDTVTPTAAAAGFTISGTTGGLEDGQVATITIVDSSGNPVDSYTPTVNGNVWSVSVTPTQAPR